MPITLLTYASHDLFGQLACTLEEDVASGLLPGALLRVTSPGAAYDTLTIGMLDVGRGIPLRKDAIYRVYSLTKSLTALATLALEADGMLSLDDPVGAYLKAFSQPSVVTSRGTRPAETILSIRDLLRQTSGIAGGAIMSSAIAPHYAERGIKKFDHRSGHPPLATVVSTLATAPLAFDPGTAWEYGMSMDVLGHLLEVVSGRSLDELIEARVSGPLGMTDTGFHVRPADLERVAAPLAGGTTPPGLVTYDAPPAWLSGGSGAYSTLHDLERLSQFLLNSHRGTPPSSVPFAAPLLTDQIGTLSERTPDYVPGHGYGFSFGLHVPAAAAHSTVGWLGRAGTTFAVNLESGVGAVLMTQTYGRAIHYRDLLREAVEGTARSVSDRSVLAAG